MLLLLLLLLLLLSGNGTVWAHRILQACVAGAWCRLGGAQLANGVFPCMLASFRQPTIRCAG